MHVPKLMKIHTANVVFLHDFVKKFLTSDYKPAHMIF